jgi:cell division transport system permease protein
MALSYSFRLAAQSILHEKWINLLSVLTIATGLFFLSLTLLSVYNIDVATEQLPGKFSVMLYLNDNASQQEKDNIMNAARGNSAVQEVKLIPKDQALRELKSTLKDMEYVLEGLADNPLPDSIEIKFKSESMTPGAVKSLSAELKSLKGVSEIEYGEDYLSSLYSLRKGMMAAGISFIIIMSAGMLFVCYSTVKILFFRREKEIETYILLGATKGFVRTPFLIEGAVIGLFGGLLSLVGVLSLYYLVIFRLGVTFPIFKLIIFPIDASYAIPLAGLVLGTVGAAIAIGRIRY